MRRKLIIAAMAVMLPFGFIATIGSGVAAAKGSTTFDGNISCNLQGTISIKPAINLTTPVTSPVTVTAKLTNNNCIGLDGTSTTQGGETLISSTESLTYSVPPTSPPTPGCDTLAGASTTSVPSSTIKWKGSSKITSTVLGAATATINASAGTITITGSVTSGWSGSGNTYSITLYYNSASLIAACGSKKGLSKFSVTAGPSGDNLEIGPAF